MSVSRNINIRLLSNKIFSDLISEFEGNRWIFSENNEIQTLNVDDKDDFDFISYSDFELVKQILDNREKNNFSNHLLLWDTKTEELFNLSVSKEEKIYKNYEYHYEISINFDGFKRITGAERYTDYGFYLNDLLPELLNLGCYICEIECRDFDS